MIRPAQLIQRKRDGGELSADELRELVLGYAREEIPDYQLAAFCMAVYFRGLTSSERHALTEAMIASGETIDLGAALGGRVVDKHSTGGVGDKSRLAVGAVVAACGVRSGKMSGRGIGHTGGRLDKRESVASLTGAGRKDFAELVLDASAYLLALSDLGVDVDEGRGLAGEAVADGSARATYDRWIIAQGGDPAESALPRAPVVAPVEARRAGFVARLGASAVGLAALNLGAGRLAKDDAVDHAVGVVCRRKRGDEVAAGEVLAEVHARDERTAADGVREVLDAYELADDPPPQRPLVLEVRA